jgi:integrase
MLNGFNKYLKEKNLSPQTIEAYLYTVEIYQTMYKRIDKDSVLSFKGYLLENFKVKTVNLRIQALNKYLEYLNKKELKVTAVKIQQKPFLENVISDADYEFLKKSLKKDKNYEWYFVVRFLAATGARVSELIQIKVEHICLG